MTASPTPTEAEKVVAELRWRDRVLEDGSRTEATIERTREALRSAAAIIESQSATIERLNGRLTFALDEGTSWAVKAGEFARRVTALETEKAGYIATLVEADATLTGEDAFALDPIVGSHNPHENAAGLVRAALSSTEVKNDG